jgi:hypothetical protein
MGGIISGPICQSVRPDLQRPGPISGVGALVETIEADKGRVTLDLQHRPASTEAPPRPPGAVI